MFHEYVKDCRERKAPVKVFLINGGCIQGRTEQIGPEAIVIVNAEGVRSLAMKAAIASACPGDHREGR